MRRTNVIILTCLAIVAGLCGNAVAIDVLQGETVTLTGTVVDNNSLSTIIGTLIIDAGADVNWAGRAIVNGDRDFEAGEGAEIIMNGDRLTVNGSRLGMGTGKDAYLFVNSGYVSVNDFMLADDAGGVHRVYVNGGTFRVHGRMDVDGGDNGARDSHIFVGGGTFIVEDLGYDSPQALSVTENRTTGEPILQAAEGYEGLIIDDYNSGQIVTAIPGPWAVNPDPGQGDENLCPDVVLGWTAGPRTQATYGHDVYLGTNYNDVNDANSAVGLGVYEGRQTETNFDPSPDLELGTTYYWRIDEVNDAESWSPWKGNVWSFTINDGNAYDFDPEQDEIKVPLDEVLSWHPGCLVTSQDVYFSTDEAQVQSMAGAALKETLSGAATSWDPCDFEYLQDYYWRIVGHSATQTWAGPVLHFQAKGAVVDENMILWYEFNETDGNSVSDSSGYQLHGIGHGVGAANWDQADSHDGGSISMDGGQFIEVPEDIRQELGSHELSICLWFKEAWNYGQSNWAFGAGFEITGWPVEWNMAGAIPALNRSDVFFMVGEVPGSGECDESDSNDAIRWTTLEGASPEGWRPDWHHLVFIKNENDNTMSVYFDGLLADHRTDANNNTLEAWRTKFVDLRIGSHWQSEGTYVGKMDDFRIYNKALSAEEVVLLFRGDDVATAWGANPSNGSGNVRWDATLTWQPGDYTQTTNGHEIYFGTSWDDVNSASSPVATRNLGDEQYEPGQMELGRTYYWRVDEVNEPNTWKGNVWRFTVAEYVVLDDFESYDKSTNLIWYTWYCKPAMPYGQRSGAILSLSYDPAHAGAQAMKYDYETDNTLIWDQDYAYADACLPLDEIDGFQDWTSVDVRLLTIFFYGQPGNDTNDTEQMYMAVHNADGNYAEVRYGDHPGEAMSDLKIEEWQRWDVPLVWFTDSNAAVAANVDFSAISSVYLGFGDRMDPCAAGNGTVFFDNLRLSMPFCNPDSGPVGDLTGDCFVGVADIGEIADQWLTHDINVNPVTEPPTEDPNLVGHWKLDGDATDSSANAYHGVAEGDYSWVAGMVGSGAIELDGGWVVVYDNGLTPKLRPKHYVSVMAWIYLDGDPTGDCRLVIKGRDNYETFGLEVSSGSGLKFLLRDANNPGEVLSVSSGGDAISVNEWIHVAGIYDNSDQTCYVNALEEDSATRGSIELLADANDGLGIGGRYPASDTSGRFNGSIDDVRVYDRAVTAAEIGYIVCGSDGVCPLESEANLYSGEEPEVINFRDFAKIFEYWGDEQLWPPQPLQ